MTTPKRRFPALRRPSLAALDRIEERQRDYIVLGIVLAVGIVYPLAFRFLPSALPLPNLNALIVMSNYAVLALGLNIVVGFAGLLDLGYVAFFVIGAYTTAFLASPHFGVHVLWWLVVWIAVAAAAVSGVLLGAPTLRLRGDYLAIVTLGFGEIVPLVFRNLGDVSIGGQRFNLTNGNLGINPIDPPTLPIPGPWGSQIVFSNINQQFSLYLILLLLVLSYFFCVRMRDSRMGRAWMAIREDETAAAAMGINTVTTKLLAFSLGASFSGFAGAFIGAYQTAIFPESFKFTTSITILVMVILGGMGNLRGVILGAFAVQYVNLTLLQWLGGFVNAPINALGRSMDIPVLSDIMRNFVLHSYNFLLFGIALVVMMIVRPEGFLPTKERRAELHGVGVASEETAGTADELATAEVEAAAAEVPLAFGSARGAGPPDQRP
jgi:branched-chain amino acid transport system permease protein